MYANQSEYFDAVMPFSQREEARVKPLVKAVFLLQPELGARVVVIPVDHPATYLNGRIANTSAVVKVNDDGSFETLNTIYQPTLPTEDN